MQIFSLSPSLYSQITHTHTIISSNWSWSDITRSTTRIPAKSILPSFPRISKPFVYLEPPFHYLETARFFFLSQQTLVWTKTEEEAQEEIVHRGRGFLHPFGYSSILGNGSWSTVKNIWRESRLASFQFLLFIRW